MQWHYVCDVTRLPEFIIITDIFFSRNLGENLKDFYDLYPVKLRHGSSIFGGGALFHDVIWDTQCIVE
jgi:hypothetical protein